MARTAALAVMGCSAALLMLNKSQRHGLEAGRTVDGAFLLNGPNEYVKWPIQLEGNFSVRTRFRISATLLLNGLSCFASAADLHFFVSNMREMRI